MWAKYIDFALKDFVQSWEDGRSYIELGPIEIGSRCVSHLVWVDDIRILVADFKTANQMLGTGKLGCTDGFETVTGDSK